MVVVEDEEDPALRPFLLSLPVILPFSSAPAPHPSPCGTRSFFLQSDHISYQPGHYQPLNLYARASLSAVSFVSISIATIWRPSSRDLGVAIAAI